jgi:hypothetical protein
MVNKVTGKQARIIKARMPKITRIVLVVIFMMHLQSNKNKSKPQTQAHEERFPEKQYFGGVLLKKTGSLTRLPAWRRKWFFTNLGLSRPK